MYLIFALSNAFIELKIRQQIKKTCIRIGNFRSLPALGK